MLTRLHTRGFKSLAEVTVDLPALTVLYGPNAVGKSNLLDAIFLLKRLATQRTLADALGSEIRGYPAEQLTFPPGGLTELFGSSRETLLLESDLLLDDKNRLRYRVEVAIEPRSGKATVVDEYLGQLNRVGQPRGRATIEKVESKLVVRRQDGHRPQDENVGLSHTILSDPRRGPPTFTWIERARREFESIRTYYLDPRVAMRAEVPPREVFDIGTFGQSLAQFLYTLKNSEHHKHFAAVRRTLKAVIPSVQDFQVDLNRARGTLDLEIVQNKIPFSVRMASEGTLRVLALIAIAVNPWPSSVIAFEEPENGVHLRRLELIAELLSALALERDRQVIVTTHSPHFCEQILKIQKRNPGKVGLFVVQQEGGQTNCKPFLPTGPLFERREISEKLVVPAEDGWFQGMVLRGLVDA